MSNEEANNMSNWVNIREAAKMTGYSRGHVRWLARQERIRAMKVTPKAWLVHKSDLLEHQATVEPGRPKERDHERSSLC